MKETNTPQQILDFEKEIINILKNERKTYRKTK